MFIHELPNERDGESKWRAKLPPKSEGIPVDPMDLIHERGVERLELPLENGKPNPVVHSRGVFGD